ncbi:MAG: universal stress protein [Gemmatimonadota bacterium]|nr:universal stress protein [Gemmatimonadota bacterium]
MKIREILHPTDLSGCSEQALAHGVAWARRHGARLHVLHVVEFDEESPASPVFEEEERERVRAEARERATAEIERTLDDHGALDLVAGIDVVWALSAARAIVERAGEGIDLIAMGTHGRTGFRALLIGSVTDEVIRATPCPVLAVRESHQPRPLTEPRRILVPIDFSPAAEEAIRTARELAGDSEARITLLHVVEQAIVPDFYYPVSGSLFLDVPELRSDAEDQLRRLWERAGGSDVPVEFRVTEGWSGSTIPRFAEENGIDLVVMPTHGLRGVERLLLGSTTDKVVRRTPCPILVMRPDGAEPEEG